MRLFRLSCGVALFALPGGWSLIPSEFEFSLRGYRRTDGRIPSESGEAGKMGAGDHRAKMAEISKADMDNPTAARQLCSYLPEEPRSGVFSGHRTAIGKIINGRVREKCRRRRCCPCAPGSNPGNRPVDRHAAQKALL
jgi:hypothetical protein